MNWVSMLILVLVLCGLLIYEYSGKKPSINTNKVRVEEEIVSRKSIIRNVKGTAGTIRIMTFEGHEYLIGVDDVHVYSIIHSESCRKCSELKKGDN
jgi:hypothetical protein